MRKKIIEFLQSSSLFDTKHSEVEKIDSIVRIGEGYTLIAIGTTTMNHVSIGLPLDVISYFVSAISISKILHKKVMILIGDYFSLSQDHICPKAIQHMANEYQTLLQNAIKNLDLEDRVTLKLASDESQNKSFQKIYENLGSDFRENEYYKRQVAMLAHFSRDYIVDVKISWTTGNENSIDEMSFDRLYNRYFPNTICHFYIVPAQTMHKHKNRMAPYLSEPGTANDQIFLKHLEPIFEKYPTAGSGKTAKKYRRYMNKVVALFENNFFPLEGKSIPEKLVHLSKEVFGLETITK
ncbi:MAG: hypothetical protein GY754_07500 [bacterium]|nr:hypothetical protein [bacterium]